jgi:hypothetical protein
VLGAPTRDSGAQVHKIVIVEETRAGATEGVGSGNCTPVTGQRAAGGWHRAVVVAIVGTTLLLGLEAVLRPSATLGIYFQFLDSETSMHTLPLEDLRDAPLRSIMNLHTQPPALDVTRAAIIRVCTWRDPSLLERPRELLLALDRSLFTLWAAVYGIMAGVIYSWLERMIPRTGATLGALVFLAHPASVLYASFPDATILVALLVLVAYFALWRLSRDPDSSVVPLACAVLALFFSRSIFQVPVVALVALSLELFRVPRRRIALFLAITLPVMGLYVGKQYYMFGTFSTTTWTGLNLTKSIGGDPNRALAGYWDYLEIANVPESSDDGRARVLTRKHKLTGAPNFNHWAFLERNQELLREYRATLADMSPGDLADHYARNALLFLDPSSSFLGTLRVREDILVEWLPWRSAFDGIFSSVTLVVLVLVATTAATLRAGIRRWRTLLGLAVPALFIAAVSITCERGENMRYKYPLEPVLIVLLAAQLAPAIVTGVEWLRRLPPVRACGRSRAS